MTQIHNIFDYIIAHNNLELRMQQLVCYVYVTRSKKRDQVTANIENQVIYSFVLTDYPVKNILSNFDLTALFCA